MLVTYKKPDLFAHEKIVSYYAELECLINESAILATTNNKPMCLEHIKMIMNRMAFQGIESDSTLQEVEKRKIAIHEAGHAIVALYLLPNQLVGASIIPQGRTAPYHHVLIKYRRVVWQCNHKFDGEQKCSTPHLTEERSKIVAV